MDLLAAQTREIARQIGKLIKLKFESISIQSNKIPNLPQFAVGLRNRRELDPAKRAIRETGVIVTHSLLRSKGERIRPYV
jgi:hypothetical protein